MLRVCRLRFLVPVTAAVALTLDAQQPFRAPATPLCRPSALFSPFVAPVAHVPVKAVFVVHLERPRSDGSTETLGSTFKVERDSKGRISRELRELMPGASSGASSLLGLVLYDPRTHMSQTIDPQDRTDVEVQVHLQPLIVSRKTPVMTSAGVQIEDLGGKTISGLDVKGIRQTWSNPAQFAVEGQPSQSSVEIWYSDDLHMVVAERRTNSSGRVEVITLAAIDQHQPSPSLFRVPRGYSVIRPQRQIQQQRQIQPQRQLFTRFTGAGSWSVENPWLVPPDYDPNDGNGGSGYPSVSITPVPGR